MSVRVFLIVLSAALLHAGWNALVKGSQDKSQAMLGVALGHVPFASLALLFVGLPSLASLPYVVAGAFLHAGYQLLLSRSYRDGDLTQVYPLARGSAPLMTAFLSTFLLHEHLGPAAWAGVAMIAVGIMSLVAVRRDDGIWDGRSAGFAVLTGAFIAAYSLNDGVGARLGGTAIGFYGVLAILNAVLIGGLMHWRRPGLVTATVRSSWAVSALSGGASFTAFAIVVWAFTQAPIALVAALRESSVIFALLIGVFFLRERLNLAKLTATAATSSGALLVKLAK